MDHFDLLQIGLELCQRESATRETVAAVLRTALARMGFNYFACCSHCDPLAPPRGAILLHNYPSAWAEEFSAAGLYRLDPVLRLAECMRRPFFWDTAFRTRPVTQRQRAVLSAAADYGIAHGYTVPLNALWIPGTLHASCSVVPAERDIDPRNYLCVQLLALCAYVAVDRASNRRSGAPEDQLTVRERECLTLAARGKTDWEIGRVLGLAQTTVHYHIERAKQRYNVVTRIQAVAQALRTGEIRDKDVMMR